MRRFYFLTIYPDLLSSTLSFGILQQAAQKGLVEYHVLNLRDFAVDQHGSIDDRPYGGGDGMVLRIEPIVAALRTIAEPKSVLYPCPKGKAFIQADAQRLSDSADKQNIVILCGRFGGIDQRVVDHFVSESFSLGDFVCAGGEFPALAMLEAMVRLVPGVLGNRESSRFDSFSGELSGQLESAQYTRPPVFEDLAVPEVLLGGDHAAIRQWRQQESARLTAVLRPDLRPKK